MVSGQRGQRRLHRSPLVRDVMSTEPVCIGPDRNVWHAWELMRVHRIRHLPVASDDGVLLGLITQRDLIDVMASEKGARRRRLDRAMRKEVRTVDPSCCAASAARFMVETKMGCLPVVDGSGVVGMLTEADFALRFARLCDDCGCAPSLYVSPAAAS